MRRDRGAGTIRQQEDGRWVGQVSLTPDPVTGRRRRKTIRGESRREVLTKMREVQRAIEDGDTVATGGRITVSRFIDTYTSGTLEARVVSGALKRSTAENYCAMLAHVGDLLGARQLSSITPSDVETLLRALAIANKSRSTQRSVYGAFRQMLDVAVRDGHLRRNPAAIVERPSAGSGEAAHLAVDEIRELIDRAGEPLRTAIIVLAHTGLRRGELLALRWSDVDLVTGQVTVSGTLARTRKDGLSRTLPKSAKSRRVVDLTPVAREALKVHRGRENVRSLDGYVFTSGTGGPWEPRNFSRQFGAVASRAGLHCGPHVLRHSAATMMIAAGVALPTVSEVLGHSDIKITTGTYNHVIAEQRKAATDAIGTALASS